MISLQQNGRAVPITVQELVVKTFGSPSRPKGVDMTDEKWMGQDSTVLRRTVDC